MPYYAAGDYYTGDYYQGDVFGFIKKAAKTAVGAVKGFARGGPVGAVSGAIAAATGGGRPPLATPTIHIPTTPTIGTALVPIGRQGPDVPPSFPGAVPEPGAMGAIQRFLPFGQSGFTGAPAGYHINKTYLRYLRAQAMGKAVQNPFNEPRARNVIVKNRRTNPLNPRALRRSIGRQKTAVGLMRSVLSGTGYTISRRGLGGKKRRKR